MDGTHDIFVGQVGFWLPWDPEPMDVQDQEYMEKDLNTLMKSKKENEMKKNMHFEEEKRKKMEYNMQKGKGLVNDFEQELYKEDPWTQRKKEAEATSADTTTDSNQLLNDSEDVKIDEIKEETSVLDEVIEKLEKET